MNTPVEKENPPLAGGGSGSLDKNLGQGPITESFSWESDGSKAPSLSVLVARRFTGKRFELIDGQIVKKTASTVFNAEGRTVPVGTAKGFATLLEGLCPRSVLVYGQTGQDTFTLDTDFRRQKTNFRHSGGRGLLLLDYDTDQMPPEVAARIAQLGGPVAAMEHVWPELRTAWRVFKPSSSAGVYKAGGDPAEATGFHLTVMLQDQRRSKETLETLQALCWEAGLGWVKIAKNGRPLERSIFDAAVYGAERLVFAAPPELGEGVFRQAPPIVWQEGEAIRPPQAPQSRLGEINLFTARAAAAPAVHTQRRVYRRDSVRRLMERGMPVREAVKVFKARIEGGIIADADLLELQSGEWVTAASLLDDGSTENLSLPCPVEGSAYGTSNATLLRGVGRTPVLVSHAHGGKAVYYFERFMGGAIGKVINVLPLQTAEQAQKVLKGAVAEYFKKAENCGRGFGDHELTAFAVGLGLGKTTKAIAGARTFLDRVKLWSNEDWAGVFAVPNHTLGAEVAREAETKGLDVVHLRGVGAPDPKHEGHRMCRNLTVMEEWQRLSLDTKKLCAECPFADECSYQKQKHLRGELYIVAHHSLGHACPVQARGQCLGFVVVDENATDARLFGTSGPKLTLDLEELAQAPEHPEARGYREKLAQMVALNGVGYLLRETIVALGGDGWATATWQKEAVADEWKRKVENPADPKAKHNTSIRLLERLWREIAAFAWSGAEASGRMIVTPAGITVRGITPLGRGWTDAPLLQLDGTADALLLQAVWEKKPKIVEIKANEDHMTIEQDWTRSGAKGQLLANADPQQSEKNKKTSRNWQKKLRRLVWREAAKEGAGKLLVVTYKDLLPFLGKLPPNVKTAHFGALRGLNGFQDCTAALIIGRNLPRESDVRVMAETITGAPVVGGLNYSGEIERKVLGKDGLVRAMRTKGITGADVMLRVMRQIRDAEMVQAIGRLRAVHRGKERLRVMVLGDAEMDRPVTLNDKLWDNVFKPDPWVLQAEAGSAVFLTANHAQAAYPDLWPSKQQARRVFSAFETPEAIDIKELFADFPYTALSPIVKGESEEKPSIGERAVYDADGTNVEQACGSYAEFTTRNTGKQTATPWRIEYSATPSKGMLAYFAAHLTLDEAKAMLLAVVPKAKVTDVSGGPRRLVFAPEPTKNLMPTRPAPRHYRVMDDGVAQRVGLPTSRDAPMCAGAALVFDQMVAAAQRVARLVA